MLPAAPAVVDDCPWLPYSEPLLDDARGDIDPPPADSR